MTAITITKKQYMCMMREHLGITETLLRLSVGLENADDIISDLKQAPEE